MASTTIRICAQSHRSLKEIALASGQSIAEVLEEAIEERCRAVYLEGVNADYAALNPKARADLQKEIDLWDSASDDGLEGL